MGRFIAILFVIIGIASAISVLSLRTSASITLETTRPAAVTIVESSVDTTGATFAMAGTLVFYPNNVGPVPYLFYQDPQGNTVAKALTFLEMSPIDSSWSGAHIFVTGTVDNEHVIVSHITYLSGP